MTRLLRYRHPTCAVAALVFSAASPLSGAETGSENAEAVFRVSSTVLHSRPMPVGLNVHVAREYQGSSAHADFNLWSRAGNPEGFYTVLKGSATGGGETFLENRREPFASFRGVYGDGFFTGGCMRIFRYEGDSCRLLRVATVASYTGGGEESPNRFIFAETGPAVQPGDEYVVELGSSMPGPGLRPDAAVGDGLLASVFVPSPAGTTLLIDPSAAAPGGGNASLRAEFASKGELRLLNWYPVPKPALSAHPPTDSPPPAAVAVPQGEAWVRYHPQRTYEFSGWFKQAPGGSGKLFVQCGGLAGHTVDLGPTWQEVRFSFSGGPPDPARPDLVFGLTGPGTLWMDNIAVVEQTGEADPFDFYADMQDALRLGQPGFLRIWPIQSGLGTVLPLEQMVSGYFHQPWLLDGGRFRTFAMADLHQMLALCERVGALPWIVVSTFYPPESWSDLIEYLAGPKDTPMGAIRAARGRPAPWIASFPQVLLESGNEVWNGMFQPQDFARRPEDYARYADLMFRTAGNSPYYHPDRIKFVANGFISSLTGFTESVASTSRHADYIDIANYIGGWEAGSTDTAASGDIAFQSRLLYGPTNGLDLVREFSAVLERVNAERDKPLRGAVYEAGPGYSLPGSRRPIDWDEQVLGKSLASAIGTLDQYFNYTAAGIDLIGHFNFGRGNYWNTHADDHSGWRPHAVYLALELRNRYGRGDLLRVDALRCPTIDLPARVILKKRNDGSIRGTPEDPRTGVPLVGCHAFRDGDSFSVFLISRRMTQSTTVHLQLPWSTAPGVTLARLSGDSPRANNISEPQVHLEVGEHPNLDLHEIDLPPHTILVLHGRIQK